VRRDVPAEAATAEPAGEDFQGLANAFACLAHPVRLAILRELRRGPRTAVALARLLRAEPAMVQHYLHLLRRVGLVRRRSGAAGVAYAVDGRRLRVLAAAVDGMVP
jgi:DNA-binding IclR family transcriptional regulator